MNTVPFPKMLSSEIAFDLARTLLDGFDKHYRLFRHASKAARRHFEIGAWPTTQLAARERIGYYDQRVPEGLCFALRRVVANFQLDATFANLDRDVALVETRMAEQFGLKWREPNQQHLTDCNFRDIPQARNEEDELAAEPCYPIGKHDVFPEQFEKFLLGNEKIRHYFLKHHAPLLTRAFWQSNKERILASVVDDVFPYPQQIRFCKHAAGATPAAGTPSYFGELLS
jgi:isocitrate dehydrogenase kinase/phosphatase